MNTPAVVVLGWGWGAAPGPWTPGLGTSGVSPWASQGLGLLSGRVGMGMRHPLGPSWTPGANTCQTLPSARPLGVVVAVTMGAQPPKADALPAQALLRVWWYLRDQPSSTSQASAGFCLDTASCSRESGMTVCLVTKAAPAMICPPLWDSETWQSTGIMEREHPCWQGSDLLQDSSPNAPSPPLLWSPMGGFSGPEASPGTAPPGRQLLPRALRRGGMPLPKASIPIPGPPAGRLGFPPTPAVPEL